MIKNGKPIRLNRYRGKERCPIESGMKREWQKKGGGEERGMIDFRQRNNRFGQLIDGRFPAIIREIVSSKLGSDKFF